MATEFVVGALFAAGVFFFLAGSVALLRFPDLHSRLHALTKADNVGLGCIALGAALETGELAAATKILLVWVIVLIGGSLVSFVIAQRFPGRPAGRAGEATER